MAYTMIGNVYRIGKLAVRKSNDKEYYSRTLVLEQKKFDPYTGEALSTNYPQVEFYGNEKCNKLDEFATGALVDVEFTVDGFEYERDGEKRNFTKVKALSIKLHDNTIGKPNIGQSQQPQTPPPLQASIDVDDLPFS